MQLAQQLSTCLSHASVIDAQVQQLPTCGIQAVSQCMIMCFKLPGNKQRTCNLNRPANLTEPVTNQLPCQLMIDDLQTAADGLLTAPDHLHIHHGHVITFKSTPRFTSPQHQSNHQFSALHCLGGTTAMRWTSSAHNSHLITAALHMPSVVPKADHGKPPTCHHSNIPSASARAIA